MTILTLNAWPLKHKLLWLVILPTSFAVALLTAAVNTFLSAQALEDEARGRAEVEVNALARGVHNFFDRAAYLTLRLADRQKGFGRGADPSTIDYIRAVLDATPPSAAQGVYIAFEGKDYREPDAIQYLKRSSLDKASRVNYDFHDTSEKSEWYRSAKAKAEGDYSISKPYLDEGGGDISMVSVTRPIYDQAGAFVGVAGVDLDMEQLIKYVQERLVMRDDAGGGREYAYLVSHDERVFAHPDQAPKKTPYLELSSLPEGRLVKGKPEDTLQRVDLPSGERRRISWTSSQIPGWKVVHNIPEAQVMFPIRKIALFSIGITALYLALMIAVGSIILNWVTGPINTLTAAAARVEAGDYRPGELSDLVQRAGEFGQLARGFRRMVQEVGAREAELRAAQDDLASRERHYRALIENATDIITILGPGGVICYASPSVERILGYSSRELTGQAALDFIHPDDRAEAGKILQEIVEQRRTHDSSEYRFRHKDGSWRTLEALSSNLIDDPAVCGIVVNCRDVTERKRAEDQIRRLNSELEERVRLRTAALEQKNEELEAAKEATVQAMKQREDFLDNVTHDLRTPLAIVIGYGQDLLRQAKRKGQDSFIPDLKLIVNKGKDLFELINDQLTLSRAMNDKGLELELERFDVAEMVRSRMEGTDSIAQKSGNTIEFCPEDGLGSMVADKAKVGRVLMNLLTNACKFTKNGTITITAARSREETGNQVVFQVVDTGMGMTQEQQKRLFDRFSQVHCRDENVRDGVGLGLAICLLYCKAMGGRITVSSEECRGSTFTVVLPAEVQPSTAASAIATTDSPPRAALAHATSPLADGSATSPRDFTANLILIVDDDASVCELMQRNLGAEGFEVRTARSGEEGLRLAKQLLPSAIILDVVMPGIDGWGVLAALRADSKTAKIPIIMASMLDERERGLRMGADEYMTKPLGRDVLSDLVRKHVGHEVKARLLVVEDDVETSDAVCRSLREQDWEVYAASDGITALKLLREHRPDLILLDLLLPSMNGFEVIDEVRQDPESRLVPIVVMTAAQLSADDRAQLQGQVEQILHKGLYSRDELLREVRALVREHQHRGSPQLKEKVDAQDPLCRR